MPNIRGMIHRRWLLAFVVAQWACHAGTQITPLTGLDPTSSTDDLKPFAQMVGDASVVGLGEGMHTSGGYHQAKYRLVRFLVEELGFRVLTWETPRLDASATTAYFATCSGTADGALAGINGVYQSTVVRDMFDWACQFNKQHPNDPVSFYGFDIQDPWREGPALKSFLAKAAPADATQLSASLDVCDGVTFASESAYWAAHPSGPPMISSTDYANCQNAVSTIDGYLTAHETALVAASSSDEVTLARLDLRAIRAWEGQIYNYYTNPPQSGLERDSAMADVFVGLRKLRFAHQRSIVWAHDGHVFRHSEVIGGIAQDGGKVMGTFLADQLGDAYQAFGTLSYQVDVNWPGQYNPGCQALSPPTDRNALEVILHDLGKPYLLVDLDAGASNPVIDPSQTYEMMGNGLVDDTPASLKPHEQFRGLVYLDHSPAMTSTVWGACSL